MTREDVVPVAALVVLSGQKIKQLMDTASGEDKIELLDALNAINYAAHVLADLVVPDAYRDELDRLCRGW